MLVINYCEIAVVIKVVVEFAETSYISIKLCKLSLFDLFCASMYILLRGLNNNLERSRML